MVEVINAIQLVIAPPDSQFRLKDCSCGNDQPVYIQGTDGLWRAQCLTCGNSSTGHEVRHDAQVEWNKECCQ